MKSQRVLPLSDMLQPAITSYVRQLCTRMPSGRVPDAALVFEVPRPSKQDGFSSPKSRCNKQCVHKTARELIPQTTVKKILTAALSWEYDSAS